MGTETGKLYFFLVLSIYLALDRISCETADSVIVASAIVSIPESQGRLKDLT